MSIEFNFFGLKESIKENEAVIASKSGALKALKVIKCDDGFYVLMKFSWSADEIFLATQRNRREPRKFRDIGRLIKYIEETYPGIKNFTKLRRKPRPSGRGWIARTA